MGKSWGNFFFLCNRTLTYLAGVLHSREKTAFCYVFGIRVYSCVPLVSWQMHLLSFKAFWTFHIVLCFEATDVCDKQMVMALNLNIFKYFVVYILWGGMYSVLLCRTDALNENFPCQDAWWHFLGCKPINHMFSGLFVVTYFHLITQLVFSSYKPTAKCTRADVSSVKANKQKKRVKGAAPILNCILALMYTLNRLKSSCRISQRK